MTHLYRSLLMLALLAGVATPAAAYIGPGAGLSLLGALWGLLAAIGAALLFVIMWPFRRMLRRRRANKPPQADAQPMAPRTSDSETPSDRSR